MLFMEYTDFCCALISFVRMSCFPNSCARAVSFTYRMSRALTLVVLGLWACAVCAETGLTTTAANCAGAGFDLSALAGSDIAGADGSYKYILQLCGTTTESVCAGNGGSLCQYNTATPPVYSHVLSKWDASGVWSQCTDAGSCPSECLCLLFACRLPLQPPTDR
jgi:hypothetical protein